MAEPTSKTAAALRNFFSLGQTDQRCSWFSLKTLTVCGRKARGETLVVKGPEDRRCPRHMRSGDGNTVNPFVRLREALCPRKPVVVVDEAKRTQRIRQRALREHEKQIVARHTDNPVAAGFELRLFFSKRHERFKRSWELVQVREQPPAPEELREFGARAKDHGPEAPWTEPAWGEIEAEAPHVPEEVRQKLWLVDLFLMRPENVRNPAFVKDYKTVLEIEHDEAKTDAEQNQQSARQKRKPKIEDESEGNDDNSEKNDQKSESESTQDTRDEDNDTKPPAEDPFQKLFVRAENEITLARLPPEKEQMVLLHLYLGTCWDPEHFVQSEARPLLRPWFATNRVDVGTDWVEDEPPPTSRADQAARVRSLARFILRNLRACSAERTCPSFPDFNRPQPQPAPPVEARKRPTRRTRRE